MPAGTGFRVFASPPPLDPALIARFAELDLVNVADAMYGLGSVDGEIRPIFDPVRRVVGPALTVTVSPGNGQMIRRAILLARPGDVMVVNAFGNVDRAVLGGSVIADMAANGIAALVVDGAVRDLAEIRAQDFPVHARRLTSRSGTDVSGKGEVNAPVACGGVAVLPGDLVIADEEGVVVVPRRDAAALAAKAEAVQAVKGATKDLGARRSEARAGQVRGYGKVAEALTAGGCVEITNTWAKES
jgi:regulator of RNase E activity RraA